MILHHNFKRNFRNNEVGKKILEIYRGGGEKDGVSAGAQRAIYDRIGTFNPFWGEAKWQTFHCEISKMQEWTAGLFSCLHEFKKYFEHEAMSDDDEKPFMLLWNWGKVGKVSGASGDQEIPV